MEDGPPATLAACPETRYRALLDAEVVVHEELWSHRLWRRLWLADGRVREEGKPAPASASPIPHARG